MYYSILGKRRPSVWDKGTIYTTVQSCSKCSGTSEIQVLGAHLPTWKRPFGLIYAISGVIGSQKSTQYLFDHGIVDFKPRKANVSWGATTDFVSDSYYELQPKHVFELDTESGPGPVVECDECQRRHWKDNNLALPRFKGKVVGHFIQIMYTNILLVDQFFIDVCRNVPNNSYLDFEEWKDTDWGQMHGID